MNITDKVDEIVNRHWHMIAATYHFFGAAQPPDIQQTMKEQDDNNFFAQYSVGHQPVIEVTVTMQEDAFTVKLHNFVCGTMEVIDATTEQD